MSGLEFTEMSQIDLRMEMKRQFPFRFEDGNRWAVAKSWDGQAVVFELTTNTIADHPFHLSIDEIGPSKRQTVFEKSDMPHIKKFYETSDFIDRQILNLDPVYANILSNDPQPQHIVSISLAPFDPNLKYINPLAIVTNAGVCEVRVRRDNLRCYDYVLVDVSAVWKVCCKLRRLHEFDSIESLTDYYSHLAFSAVCFQNAPSANRRWMLYGATKAGMLLLFEINEAEEQAEIKFIAKTDLGPIHLLRHFSCRPAGTDGTLEFVFAASSSGLLKTYLHNSEGELLETDTLWEVKDKMSLQGFEVRYAESCNQIVIATSKSSHFLVFFMSAEGRLLRKTAYYVGLITGLQHYEDNQYAICTLNGHTTMLTVNSTSSDIQITLEEIKNDLDSKLYQVLGMTTTSNKVAWIFLQYPTELFEHSFRNPTMLSVCAFNRKPPLAVMNLRTDKKMHEFADCAEMIRCTFLKLGPSDVPFEMNTDSTEMNDDVARKLKIYLTLLRAKLSSFRKRVRNDDAKLTEASIENVRNALETYHAFKRLQRLSTLNKLTKFQTLSSAYFRKKLADFSGADPISPLSNIQLNFTTAIDNLLHRTENIVSTKLENCIFCDEWVDLTTGTCKNEHKVSRCCISFHQIPLFGARACDTCEYGALDDGLLLRQVMCDGETISCPLCGGPLTKAKTLMYLRS